MLGMLLAACAPGASAPGVSAPSVSSSGPSPSGASAPGASGPGISALAPHPFTEEDLRWLNRATFGVDSEAVARYRQVGRARFLDEQLTGPAADRPDLAAAIAAIPVAQQSAETLLQRARAEQRRIDTLPGEREKQEARDAQNRAAGLAVYETAKRHLMRALYSPSQLREQMTWFWMNHFNVFSGKGTVAWTLAEYEDTVIRPRALGRFCNLVLATTLSPAMIEYLDSGHSAAGHLNENHARELMELHTLGVSGGLSGSPYSQRDVQDLARVLTGLGLASTTPPRLSRQHEPLYVRAGLFEFNPARHDFGAKTLLGHRIAGEGLPEVAQAVTVLCRQRAAARFISGKIATYFVADDPPRALVEAMAVVFERSDGDIAAVLRAMFLAPAFSAVLGRASAGAGKFKDPMQFVISALRLAHDGTAITNYRPLVAWLNQLGQPLYGRATPEGYALVERAWASPGQMVARFEIARAIGSGRAGLFNAEDSQRGPQGGLPTLNNDLFRQAIEPTLGARTRDALARTSSEQEWNMVLLAAPEWMQR